MCQLLSFSRRKHNSHPLRFEVVHSYLDGMGTLDQGLMCYFPPIPSLIPPIFGARLSIIIKARSQKWQT